MIRAMLSTLCVAGIVATSASDPASANKGRPSQAHVAISQGDGRSIENKKPGGAKLKGTRIRKTEGGKNEFIHRLPERR